MLQDVAGVVHEDPEVYYGCRLGFGADIVPKYVKSNQGDDLDATPVNVTAETCQAFASGADRVPGPLALVDELKVTDFSPIRWQGRYVVCGKRPGYGRGWFAHWMPTGAVTILAAAPPPGADAETDFEGIPGHTAVLFGRSDTAGAVRDVCLVALKAWVRSRFEGA